MPTIVQARSYTSLPVLNPEMARYDSVRLPGGKNFKAGTILGFSGQALANEVQTLTIAGTGNFTLGLDGAVTSAIPIAALTAAAIQAALDVMLGVGQTVVTGSGPYPIAFQGNYANIDVPLLTLDNSGITGGPPTIAETTKGSPGPGLIADVADGSTIKGSVILNEDTQTDAKGAVRTEFGSGNRQANVPVLNFGDVQASLLVGLTNTLLGQVGKLIKGSAYTDAGAVVRIGV